MPDQDRRKWDKKRVSLAHQVTATPTESGRRKVRLGHKVDHAVDQLTANLIHSWPGKLISWYEGVEFEFLHMEIGLEPLPLFFPVNWVVNHLYWGQGVFRGIEVGMISIVLTLLIAHIFHNQMKHPHFHPQFWRSQSFILIVGSWVIAIAVILGVFDRVYEVTVYNPTHPQYNYSQEDIDRLKRESGVKLEESK